MHKIGFLGCGNMARAIIGGILAKGIVAPGEIIASARTQATIDAAHERFDIDVTLDNAEACKASVVFLAFLLGDRACFHRPWQDPRLAL